MSIEMLTHAQTRRRGEGDEEFTRRGIKDTIKTEEQWVIQNRGEV
jgi:hypothetical protein